MKVAIVGIGILGDAMGRRLLGANHDLTVYNRTRRKAEPLLSLGAAWADSPARAASGAELVITVVTDPAAVRTVTLGDSGILAGLPESAVHAEMSTVAPASAREIAGEYAARRRRFVQAPVLGGRAQIELSNLLIVAGGSSADIEACRPAWNVFAKRIWTMDRPEQASAMKLACNMMIAQMIVALGQSMTFARKFDLSLPDFLEILGNSSLAAPMYKTKGEALLRGDFTPNFIVANLLKDVGLACDAADQMGLDMPLSSLARELLVEAVDRGYADEDYSAVLKVQASRAGITLP